jgi:hypothetical protein
MKKLRLFFRLMPGLFVFIGMFSSCIDHRYDLTDKNLDRDIVFSPDGFNLPVGSIDTIFFGNELRTLMDGNETEILTDPATGVFYLQYVGEFPVEFPEYTVPLFENVETEIVDIEDMLPDPNPTYPISITLPASGQPLIIVSDKHAHYDMPKPDFRPTEGLEVLINQAYFTRYEMDITIYLHNLDFAANSSAKLLLSMDFPENFTFQEYPKNPQTGKTHIERTINASDFQDNHQIPNVIQYTVTEVASLFSYRYDQEDVTLDYNVSLLMSDPTTVTLTASPQFNMDFDINNNNVVLDYVIGSAIGVESVAGSIETGDFTNTFKGNVLGFGNPSLFLNLQSNLQADFNMAMTIVAKNDEGQEIGAASAGNLAFRKGTGELKEANHLLSPRQPAGIDYWTPFAMNNLFWALPKTMDYDLKAYFNDNNVKLYPEGLSIAARYTLKLPFDFETLDLQIADTIPDLFSDDRYNTLFKHIKSNLQIQADRVDLALGTDMQIEVTAKIVDGNYRNVGIEDQTFVLHSGSENTGFIIAIEQADLDKIKNARHLEFIFRLTGSGSIIDVPYPNASYIHIRNLRIISDGGLLYEL